MGPSIAQLSGSCMYEQAVWPRFSSFGCATFVVTKSSAGTDAAPWRSAAPSSASFWYMSAVSKCVKPTRRAASTSAGASRAEVWPVALPTYVPMIAMGIAAPLRSWTEGSDAAWVASARESLINMVGVLCMWCTQSSRLRFAAIRKPRREREGETASGGAALAIVGARREMRGPRAPAARARTAHSKRESKRARDTATSSCRSRCRHAL